MFLTHFYLCVLSFKSRLLIAGPLIIYSVIIVINAQVCLFSSSRFCQMMISTLSSQTTETWTQHEWAIRHTLFWHHCHHFKNNVLSHLCSEWAWIDSAAVSETSCVWNRRQLRHLLTASWLISRQLWLFSSSHPNIHDSQVRSSLSLILNHP